MTNKPIDKTDIPVVQSAGGVIMTGEELKAYRQKAKYTQKALGLLLGYKDTTAEKVVQQWEYNRQPIPIKHYRALAKILKVPLEKFIP